MKAFTAIVTLLASVTIASPVNSCSASSCDVRGGETNRPYWSSQDPRYASKTACGARCNADSTCQSFSIGEGSCRLYKGTVTSCVYRSSRGNRIFSNKCCVAPQPPSTPMCGSVGYDKESPRAFTLDTSGRKASFTACKTYCTQKQNCKSFAVGSGTCLLYSAAVKGNFESARGSPYTFWDVACPAPIAPPFSIQTSTSSIRTSATPTRSISSSRSSSIVLSSSSVRSSSTSRSSSVSSSSSVARSTSAVSSTSIKSTSSIAFSSSSTTSSSVISTPGSAYLSSSSSTSSVVSSTPTSVPVSSSSQTPTPSTSDVPSSSSETVTITSSVVPIPTCGVQGNFKPGVIYTNFGGLGTFEACQARCAGYTFSGRACHVFAINAFDVCVLASAFTQITFDQAFNPYPGAAYTFYDLSCSNTPASSSSSYNPSTSSGLPNSSSSVTATPSSSSSTPTSTETSAATTSKIASSSSDTAVSSSGYSSTSPSPSPSPSPTLSTSEPVSSTSASSNVPTSVSISVSSNLSSPTPTPSTSELPSTSSETPSFMLSSVPSSSSSSTLSPSTPTTESASSSTPSPSLTPSTSEVLSTSSSTPSSTTDPEPTSSSIPSLTSTPTPTTSEDPSSSSAPASSTSSAAPQPTCGVRGNPTAGIIYTNIANTGVFSLCKTRCTSYTLAGRKCQVFGINPNTQICTLALGFTAPTFNQAFAPRADGVIIWYDASCPEQA